MHASGFVSGSISAYAHLAGVGLHEVFLDGSACARALRLGRKRAAELFGPEARLGGVAAPGLSYGHLACLGARVTFPEHSEPGIRPLYADLKEGIRALEREVAFESSELFRHFERLCACLRREFPGEPVARLSGFRAQGPLTTAFLARGMELGADFYEQPEEAKRYLRLITQSVVRFNRFLRRFNGEEEVQPDGSGMTDDLASLVSYRQWPEFVLPYWDQYYHGLTNGRRYVHVENLVRKHLKHLKAARIAHYDPSVSKKLSARMVREELDGIHFLWRLPSFEMDNMSCEAVREWVCQSWQEGAPEVFLVIEELTCLRENPAKTRAFLEACQAALGVAGACRDD